MGVFDFLKKGKENQNQYSVPTPPSPGNNLQNQNSYWNQPQVPAAPSFNSNNQAKQEKKPFFSFGKKEEKKEIKFDDSQDLMFDLPPLPPFKGSSEKDTGKNFELPQLDEFGTSKNIPEFDVPLPKELQNMKSQDFPPLPELKPRNQSFEFHENKEKTLKAPEIDFTADFKEAPKPRVYKFEEKSETYVPYDKKIEIKEESSFKNEQSFNRDKPKRNIISPPSLPESNSNLRKESRSSQKFMNVMEYKKVLDSLEDVNSLNSEVEKITPRLLEIEKEKSIKLKELQDHLEEAERKLIMIDQRLFER